jgi:hypothetical protein
MLRQLNERSVGFDRGEHLQVLQRTGEGLNK